MQQADVPPRQGAVPEIRLALAGALTCLVLAPLAGGIGWLSGGTRSALSAAAAFLVVGLLAVPALPLYRWAGSLGPDAVGMVALLGVGLRLALATVAFAVVDRIPAVSMTSFALALAAALVATLVAEVTLSLRDPRLSFVNVNVNNVKEGATG